MSDEGLCGTCGFPRAHYGCSERDEGAFCRGPTPPPPTSSSSLVDRHPIPLSAPIVRCSLCRAEVVWIIGDDFRRFTVDARTGAEHQPHCKKGPNAPLRR